MKFIWLMATVAAVYGSVAGIFFDDTPYTAVAFGMLSVVFALVAYKDVTEDSS